MNAQTPLLDARVLLKKASGMSETELIVSDSERLEDVAAEKYEEFLRRRSEGEPVSYITGVKEFWSLEFDVTPAVLIPREDSEVLINTIGERRPREARYKILDLGTGSGCLLCALLQEFPNSTGVGVDRSEAAVSIARRNCQKLGFENRAEIVFGNWGEGLNERFDLIIANPPYIGESERADLPLDVAGFEPASALFAAENGLAAYREILSQASALLAEDGLIAFEIGEKQGDWLQEKVSKTFPNAAIELLYDLQDRPRGILADRNCT